MDELITNISDFNDENLSKIKTMIDFGKIIDIETLDLFINNDSINKNNDGIRINELSIYSDEFDKINKLSRNDLHKLLNKILPKECKSREDEEDDFDDSNELSSVKSQKSSKNREIEIKPNMMDELIGLIDQKINKITDMIQ